MAVIKAEIRTADQSFVEATYKFAESIDMIVTSISDSEVCGVLTKDLKYHVFKREYVLDAIKDIPVLEDYDVEFTTTYTVEAKDEDEAYAKAVEQAKNDGLELGLLYAYVNGRCMN